LEAGTAGAGCGGGEGIYDEASVTEFDFAESGVTEHGFKQANGEDGQADVCTGDSVARRGVA
jgi:hypothetical protein